MAGNSPLRIGILSTARIARAFCAGVAGSSLVRVATVASRDIDKAQQFAQGHSIPRVSTTYEALLADPAVDAIYIPLPNSMHVDWSIQAARAGKHVLCEKPLAPSAREARQVFMAAQEYGVHIVEGFPYRSQPQTHKMGELIKGGAIGQVKYIQAFFTFALTDDLDVRLRPDLAGGSLMDVGCYPVNLVRMIAGKRPKRVTASAHWGDSGVDRSLVGTLEFDDGSLAQIAGGFDGALMRRALIVGTAGAIQTGFYNHPPVGQPAELLIKRGVSSANDFHSIPVAAMNGFRAEAESFARLVSDGKTGWNGATAEESIDNALILESLLASARSGLPVAVD